MNLEEIYTIAERKNIDIDNLKMRSLKAVTIPFLDSYAIAVDERKMANSVELKCVLAHEIGHCKTGTLYTKLNYLELASQYEYKADKSAIEMLIPKQDLGNLIRQGTCEMWELADYFEVDEEMIEKALFIYFDIQPIKSQSTSLWS